jgi:hypothetical protein
MGTFSLSHWLIVLVVILILFGAGRWAISRAASARSVPGCAGTTPPNPEATTWSMRSRPISGGAEAPGRGAVRASVTH